MESGHGNVPRYWSKDAIIHGGDLVSEESKSWAKKLYQIEYDKRNWSWPQDPNNPDVPPVVLRDELSTMDAMGSTCDATVGRLMKTRLRSRKKRARLRLVSMKKKVR